MGWEGQWDSNVSGRIWEVPRTCHSHKGNLGWEVQWNVMFLVGHGSLEDNTVPLGLWDGDCDVSGGTWEVQRTPHNPKGTLGWEGQWDVMSQVGHRCPEDVPQCQGDFVMYLVGHGCLAEIPQSQGDFTMGRTVEL